MIALSLGLFAALCWSLHDLVARRFAPGIGPIRMALWVMLAGGALLAAPVLWSGNIFSAPREAAVTALVMGLAYALAVAGLFKAFSLAPVAIVGPFTAGYPALVVVWGIINGLVPLWSEWLALVLVLSGAVCVARMAPDARGRDAIAPGKLKIVIAASIVACICFATTVVLGQAASATLGEFETTFLSRFSAAALLVPMLRSDGERIIGSPRSAFFAVVAMAGFDVLAVSAINWAGAFPGKEFGSMGISTYGAMSVLMAMAVLKEKASLGQWFGILMIVVGVALLGWPK